MLLTVLSFLLGIAFLGLSLRVLFLEAQRLTLRGLVKALQDKNAELNQQLVSYATVAQNAIKREEAFMQKPNFVNFNPEQVAQLGELLVQYVKSVFKDPTRALPGGAN